MVMHARVRGKANMQLVSGSEDAGMKYQQGLWCVRVRVRVHIVVRACAAMRAWLASPRAAKPPRERPPMNRLLESVT